MEGIIEIMDWVILAGIVWMLGNGFWMGWLKRQVEKKLAAGATEEEAVEWGERLMMPWNKDDRPVIACLAFLVFLLVVNLVRLPGIMSM